MHVGKVIKFFKYKSESGKQVPQNSEKFFNMRPTIALFKSKIPNGFVWRSCATQMTQNKHWSTTAASHQNFTAIRQLSTPCKPTYSPWNMTTLTRFMSTPSSRHICLFSTSNNSKKSSPNSEPHINDAKARPAAQGLRLDETETSEEREPRSEVETELRTELSTAKAENATLLTKSKDLEDKYLRALAETENVRTRLTKQISDAKIFAIQGFCKDLTDIEDILRLAIDSVPQDQLSRDGHLKQLYEGLKMTDARLLQVFARHGLTQINPLDAKFNPNEHEAVVQQEIPGKESGTVVFVSKIGYKLHDRVIRPAVVGVAK